MRIGIDIDDTTIKSWDYLIPAYAKTFGVDEKKLRGSKPYYESVKDKYTIEEYFDKVGPIYEDLTPSIPLQDNVKEVLEKLHKDGHVIVFITARNRGYKDSYRKTKDYLDKNEICYDKLITVAKNKGEVCVRENIDLFIDDSLKHCIEVDEAGIPVLLMEKSYNKDDTRFKHVKNWKEIYKYIKSR